MTCVCCGERPALTQDDPRLPLLRVEACRSCRDTIAHFAGWYTSRSTGNGDHYWMRGTKYFYVSDIPDTLAA